MKKTTITTLFALSAGVAQAGSEVSNAKLSLEEISKNPELRALAADRPDSTESPITVDKGYWQVETSVLDFARDRSGGNGYETWTFAETNLKYGITDNMDLQFVFAPYVYQRTKTAGALTEAEDASDITIRLKWNLWGNDGGKTAFALFPYVKVPTGTALSNDQWEAGIIFPYSAEINDRVGLGLQAEFAYAWDENDADYDIEFLHTAVLGFAVTEKLGAYIEYLGIAGDHPYQAHASGGLTYAITDQFQWDIGAVYGLNDAAEDLNVFSGFTIKF